MATSKPYDARTLRYVASQLSYAGEVTPHFPDTLVKVELRHWANEYRLEANRIARKARK